MKVRLFVHGHVQVTASFISSIAGDCAGRAVASWKRLYGIGICAEGWEGDTYVVHAYY